MSFSLKKIVLTLLAAFILPLAFFSAPHAAQATPTPFITTWKTDNEGSSGPNQITIPTSGGGYNYDIDWGDTHSDTGVTGDITHTYAEPGTYTVTINGVFPQIFFDGGGDAQKILTVEQWGNRAWRSMQNAFYGARYLTITAVDAPNLSAVTDMSSMFHEARSMNEDLSGWDVSHVTNMHALFTSAITFNQPLNSWDMSQVTDISYMFNNAQAFDQDLSSWDVSHVTSMNNVFALASVFNHDIHTWDVSHVTTMDSMFASTYAFDQPLNDWHVGNVTNMAYMFNDSVFNQDIHSWDTSKVEDMSAMFALDNNFNQDINTWDVSHVEAMDIMFYAAPGFNQPLDHWNTGRVMSMGYMFNGATSFNQDINSWNVASVLNMDTMFGNAIAFNQPLNDWDVGRVMNMAGMFTNDASFNQPLNHWDTSSVTNMSYMFSGASSFDQDISTWDVSQVTNMNFMFSGVSLSSTHYNALLIGWSEEGVQDSLLFDAGSSVYCDVARTARAHLTTDHSWMILDGGICADIIPPTMALIGEADMSFVQGGTYTEYGATATDIRDGSLTSSIVISGTVDADVPGTYVVTYSVSDAALNAATPLTRTITVVPTPHPATNSSGGGSLAFLEEKPTSLNGTPLMVMINNIATGTATTSVATVPFIFNGGANIKGFALSFDSQFTTANIQPYTSMTMVTLPAPGTYPVYVKFYSTTGHASPVIVRNVVYTTPQTAATSSPLVPIPVAKKVTFVRILRVGSSGEDVKVLQQFLNVHGFMIASKGAGSPGKETIYFGTATANALKKFQEAHASEILFPYQLKKGSGVLGPTTMKLMNTM